jgi:hypothetical protein
LIETEKISLIIPLRLTASTYEGALRLARICETVPRDLFDIVISDYGTEDAHAGPIRQLQGEGIEVVRHPAPGKLFSIGHARDFGVQMAHRRIVLFNDIDFLGTEAMYRDIHAEAMRRQIFRNMFDFFCVPVVFLTEKGSERWFAAVAEQRPFIAEFDADRLQAAAPDIQFIAFGSSAMVVNRHHYLSLGGHDENFAGHGAEDYDLLHRLASLAPRGPRPNDYFTDFKDNGVRNYWGFRPWFALHGLDVFAQGLYLVHLWHPRRMEKGYFRSAPNFRHLRKLMLGFDRRGAMPLPLADPGRDGAWLVLYRTPGDLAVLRQVLPLSRHYRLVRTRSVPDPARLASLLGNRFDTVVVAPDVGERASRPALPAGIRLLRLRTAGPSDGLEFSLTGPAGETASVTAISSVLRSKKGRVLFCYWRQLDLAGIGRLESGDIPSPHPPTSPIFATFGGPTMLDRTSHPRPGKKKKSSFWVKLKRRMTGY